MKQRIPNDVERLMWLVAESNDPSAIADFESRFPEFSSELARRRRMVSDLKGAAKPSVPAEARIPAFVPRYSAPKSNPAGMWAVGALALVALAVASYSITKWLPHKEEKRPLPPVEQVNTGPLVVPEVVYKDPVPSKPPPLHNPTTVPQTPQTPPDQGEMPQSMRLANTSLQKALMMIGQTAGYRVDVAPGFEDQVVSIDYNGFTASQMLKDLGMKYGFTAFDQGDGSIIIVPAVDSGRGIANPDDPGTPPRRVGG